MEKLFDTINLNDALAAGHRSPIDYTEGGLRIAMEIHPVLGLCVSLFGPEGEVSLTGLAEARIVRRALDKAIGMAEAAELDGRAA